MAATADEFVAWLRSKRGITESPSGSNRTHFGERYGWNGVPWCAEFIWVGLSSLGVPILKTASAHVMLGWFASQQRLTTDFEHVRPGDIIGWNFDPRPNVVPNIEHVSAAVSAPQGNLVWHIGGNTSAPGSGRSQENGGGVYEKAYPAGVFVAAGRPAFFQGEGLMAPGRLPREQLERNDRGHDVRLWQRELNDWMSDHGIEMARLEVDGDFGPKTEAATKFYQERHGFIVDGSVGIHLIRSLERNI